MLAATYDPGELRRIHICNSLRPPFIGHLFVCNSLFVCSCRYSWSHCPLYGKDATRYIKGGFSLTVNASIKRSKCGFSFPFFECCALRVDDSEVFIIFFFFFGHQISLNSKPIHRPVSWFGDNGTVQSAIAFRPALLTTYKGGCSLARGTEIKGARRGVPGWWLRLRKLAFQPRRLLLLPLPLLLLFKE